MAKKEDLVILFSGGADSVLLMELALQLGKRPFCIMFNYNQKHVQELDFAKKYLEKRNIRFREIKLDLKVNSALTGDLKENKFDNVSEFYVPARNSIFLSIASSISEDLDISEVWYGADWSDMENRFPDCTQTFIDNMNILLESGMSKPVKVYAPLLGFTKEMVLIMLENINLIEGRDFFSGYENKNEEDGVINYENKNEEDGVINYENLQYWFNRQKR